MNKLGVDMDLPIDIRKSSHDVKEYLKTHTTVEIRGIVESAAIDNDVEAIGLVLEHETTNCDRALFYAASQGHTQAVLLLLPHANPQANDSEAFRIACQFGMLDVVKILLPASNPQCNNNYPLRTAASNGHIDVVRYILPFSDPKDINSSALLNAAFHQHWDIADLLFDISDVKKVRADLERCGPGPWNNFENEVAARRQNVRIQEEVGPIHTARIKKM